MSQEPAGVYCLFVQILHSVAPQNNFYSDNSSEISKKGQYSHTSTKKAFGLLTFEWKKQIREPNRVIRNLKLDLEAVVVKVHRSST